MEHKTYIEEEFEKECGWIFCGSQNDDTKTQEDFDEEKKDVLKFIHDLLNKINDWAEEDKYTLEDVIKNHDLSFGNYTPTEIYNLALTNLQTYLASLGK